MQLTVIKMLPKLFTFKRRQIIDLEVSNSIRDKASSRSSMAWRKIQQNFSAYLRLTKMQCSIRGLKIWLVKSFRVTIPSSGVVCGASLKAFRKMQPILSQTFLKMHQDMRRNGSNYLLFRLLSDNKFSNEIPCPFGAEPLQQQESAQLRAL